MKILLIGPYAPLGQVGAVRIISLSRYLISKGHLVYVLCLSKNSLNKIDERGLCAEVPKGVNIINYDISFDKKGLMKQNYININETGRALKGLLLRYTFDVALVSGGPFYTFPAMKVIHQSNIPYIVDYRDLHISSPEKRKRTGFINKVKFLFSYPFRYFQEYNCIKNAQLVTVVHPEMKTNLCKYFRLSNGKIEIIYNGFDDAVLAGILPVKSEKKYYTIGYFGKLMYYNEDYTIKLFNAIDNLTHKGYIIKFVHIGPENKLIENYFNKKNMNEKKWYECLGLMDYKEGMAILGSCNAFALEYAMPEGPGTKVFDYIYWNKPVIAVTKEGIALEKMLKTFENAFICHSTQEVEDAIRLIIDNNITFLASDNNTSVIQDYARSKQNSKMEKLLISVGEKS